MLNRLDDTIVAISSAPGFGRVGIVRLSGTMAITFAEPMTRLPEDRPLSAVTPSSRVLGEVYIGDSATLPADLYVFRAPRSYTRQDMVEIHTIGAPAALELVRKRALTQGAIAAEPGEFTARAFLNGAMDLPSAEAVAGVIRARTDTQLRAARRVMDGGLARCVTQCRDQLAEILALVEADIDFAEEPIEFITPDELRRRLQTLDATLQPLLEEEITTERLDVLPRILLFGPPNVGKSTLMNRLSGTSRAICAAVSGTTRDVLAAPIRVGQRDAILLDAAGVDESEDQIIVQGRQRTLSTARQVDLVGVMVDACVASTEQFVNEVRALRECRMVIAINKIDLAREDRIETSIKDWSETTNAVVLPISAKSGAGIDDLKNRFEDALGETHSTSGADSIVLTERQRSAVQAASESLNRAAALAGEANETIDCADLLAFELREALETLGAVTGEVTTDELLGQVFARFCIGK